MTTAASRTTTATIAAVRPSIRARLGGAGGSSRLGLGSSAPGEPGGTAGKEWRVSATPGWGGCAFDAGARETDAASPAPATASASVSVCSVDQSGRGPETPQSEAAVT